MRNSFSLLAYNSLFFTCRFNQVELRRCGDWSKADYENESRIGTTNGAGSGFD
jgi:hypothetical protein